VVDETPRVVAAVKYGRPAVFGLSWILAAVVFLPNGSYSSGSSVVHLNALSSPFVDYGGYEVGVVVVVALLTVIVLLRGWRLPRQSAWGFVFGYAGVLGFILPDLWTRNAISVLNNLKYHDFSVKLQYGFWLNLSLIATLLIISSVVLLNESRSSLPQ